MRIVSFTLPNFLDSGLVDDEASPVYAALQDTAHDVDGDDVLTELMSATDPRAAVFRGHPAIEHNHTALYALYMTDSPRLCDGFGTIEIGVTGGWRRVAILRSRLDWQLSRYGVALEVLEAA